jgi:hypothetical protein
MLTLVSAGTSCTAPEMATLDMAPVQRDDRKDQMRYRQWWVRGPKPIPQHSQLLYQLLHGWFHDLP